MADVELINVSKRYDDEHEAVTDLNLHVENGEFLILVGPRAAGSRRYCA